MILCAQTEKQRHPSRGKAEAHLRELKQNRGYIGHVYPCDFCGGWHVGREKKRAHKNKYREDS